MPCICGAPLRAHNPQPVQSHPVSGILRCASRRLHPPRLALSSVNVLPLFSPVLPTAALVSAPTGHTLTSAQIAGSTPIAAWTGVRLPDEGSTNDRRVASFERARSDSGAPKRTNSPRVRTTVISGTSSSSLAFGLPGPSAGPSTGASPDGSVIKFLVHLFPFKVRFQHLSTYLLLPFFPCCLRVVSRRFEMQSVFPSLVVVRRRFDVQLHISLSRDPPTRFTLRISIVHWQRH